MMNIINLIRKCGLIYLIILFLLIYLLFFHRSVHAATLTQTNWTGIETPSYTTNVIISAGDVILDTNSNSFIDSFTNNTKIALITNITVNTEAGQVIKQGLLMVEDFDS